MVLNGMNVARINFSHATKEERETVVSLVKKANKILNDKLILTYEIDLPRRYKENNY